MADEAYRITDAVFARDMTAVRVDSSEHAPAQRARRLARYFSRDRYSNRERAYIMSKAAAAKFVNRYDNGWDAAWSPTRELIPPETIPAANTRRGRFIAKITEVLVAQGAVADDLKRLVLPTRYGDAYCSVYAYWVALRFDDPDSVPRGSAGSWVRPAEGYWSGKYNFHPDPPPAGDRIDGKFKQWLERTVNAFTRHLEPVVDDEVEGDEDDESGDENGEPSKGLPLVQAVRLAAELLQSDPGIVVLVFGDSVLARDPHLVDKVYNLLRGAMPYKYAIDELPQNVLERTWWDEPWPFDLRAARLEGWNNVSLVDLREQTDSWRSLASSAPNYEHGYHFGGGVVVLLAGQQVSGVHLKRGDWSRGRRATIDVIP